MRAGVLGGLLVLGGCFEDAGAGDDGGPPAGPRSGLWLYTEDDPVDDTCTWADRPKASGEFDVTNGEDGTFTIIPRMDGPRADCVMNGDDFTCDPVLEMTPVPLLDASIETISVISGTLDTREHGDGQIQNAVACTGTQCPGAALAAGIPAFPCSYTVPFTAVFVE